MMQPATKSKLLITIFIFLVLSACSSSVETPTINPTQGAQMLAGEYTTTISAEDVQKFGALDPNLGSGAGVWNLSFTNDGNIYAHKDGQFFADGKFTVNGNRIDVYVANCDDCGCQNAIGRFIWQLKENELSFGKTAGSCDAMDLLLTTRPLTRKP
jgi:Rieske Fe-S protein